MLYSEIFRSIQGESVYTGVPSIWLRTFSCNLECRGFLQPDPADKSSYHEVGNDLDLIDIKDLTELPVFKYGCDSAYSVAKRFKHLQKEETPEEIVGKLANLLPTNGEFHNENYEFHMVFTGGEPLLKPVQKNLVELFKLWDEMDDNKRPKYITFETNGTQKVIPELAEMLNRPWIKEVLFSYSPKLYHVSGEENKRAIKPESINHNIAVIHNSEYTLKFVLTSDDRAWNELEEVVDQIGLGRKNLWIMPVGGRVEDQEASAGDVADMAIERGYKVAARVHAYLYGNEIGR